MIKITFLSGNETFLARPIDHEALAEVLRKADDIYTITDDGKPITETLIAFLLHQAAADWVQRTFQGHRLPGLRCSCTAEERHGSHEAEVCNECGLRIEPTSRARVRFYPQDVDETYDGTVIEETERTYTVIPDHDLCLTVRWDKRYCDLITK